MRNAVCLIAMEPPKSAAANGPALAQGSKRGASERSGRFACIFVTPLPLWSPHYAHAVRTIPCVCYVVFNIVCD